MAVEFLQVLALLGLGLAAAGWASHRLGLPSALGFLVVGLALSPKAVGWDEGVVHGAELAAEVAVLFLLFFIGLELDLRKLRQLLGETAVTTFFNIVVPALLVAGALRLLLGWSYTLALALGIAVGISSTIFGERLTALPGYTPNVRRRVLGILVAEDVGAAALLAILVILGGQAASTTWVDPLLVTGKLLVLVVLLMGFALLVLPRILDAVTRTHVHELVVLAGGGVILAFGAIGHFAGSAELGAFVAGVATAEAGSRFVVRNAVASLREVALAVFLFTSGLVVDVSHITQDLLLAGLVAGLTLGAMLLVNVPAALAAGFNLPDSLRTALALGTLGEFSLILVATAEQNGVATPGMRSIVVGAMVILLVVTPALIRGVPWIAGMVLGLPPGVKRPLSRAVVSIRRDKVATPQDKARRKDAIRLLASNLILLAAWVILAAWAGPRLLERFPGEHRFLAPAVVYGLAFAIASPLLYSAYRSYRDLVRLIVGLATADQRAAAKVRLRLVDSWVAVTAVILLIPVTVVFPEALPVLLGGVFLAVIIATLAWAQLSRFHRAVEATVTRVLGRDPEAGAILDQVLDKYPWGVGFTAVAIPPASPVAGQTLQKARITELTGATVAVLQRRGKETINPGHEQVLLPGDTLVLMGDAHQISRAEALVVAHGDALRLTAQSRLAQVEEVAIHDASPLAGKTLGEADIKTGTGTLVVGVWPQGAPHPQPYRPDLRMRPGDRLILLGAPLQLERARRMATEPPAPPPSGGPSAPA